MSETELSEEIINLFKKKEKLNREIDELQNKLVKKLCPKGKSQCEPAYCTFRITDSCPFLERWQNILSEANVKEDFPEEILDILSKILPTKRKVLRKKKG